MVKQYDNLEFNWVRHIKDFICDTCDQEAIMECEVNTPNGKHYGVYCKEHYETLFQDLIEEINNPLTEADYLIEED